MSSVFVARTTGALGTVVVGAGAAGVSLLFDGVRFPLDSPLLPPDPGVRLPVLMVDPGVVEPPDRPPGEGLVAAVAR